LPANEEDETEWLLCKHLSISVKSNSLITLKLKTQQVSPFFSYRKRKWSTHKMET